MEWLECSRCGKVYPESGRTHFFNRCRACRASLDFYDWTFRDVLWVAGYMVVLFGSIGVTIWLII